MVSFFRNVIIIVTVTGLVWLFAEAESLRPLQKSLDVVLSVPAQSTRTIDFAKSSEGETGGGGGESRVRVLVDLDGASSAIDAAERVLRRPLVLTPDSAGVPRTSGEQTLNLREVLREHPDLRSLAVTIRKCDPAEVRVVVDELESRTIALALDLPLAELDGPAEIRPATVTMRGPRAAMRQLDAQSTAMLRIAPDALASIVRGRKQPIASVVVTPPAALAGVAHVSFIPATVDVGVTLRPEERAVLLATVPVHVRLAPGELERWDIQVPAQDRFLTDVTLTGPLEAIKAIEEKTIAVIATVSLSFEELENGVKSKEAAFADLPPGVRATYSNRVVRLTIKPRVVKTP